ncbi:hypothetical protein [Sulfurimonas sp.]|uniref:hypothetical protein n=1 Tax=Sulfurimonas sp. TaxID=2022749 RepID=UPI002AB32278|nr:hypothetical protein [Sulfurimonas sp.]
MELNQQIISYSVRLKSALEAKNLKQKDLVKKYDYLSTSLMSKFLNNQKTITDIFSKLCSDENINIHWIATGHGDMFVQDCNGVNVTNHSGNVAVNGTITINTKDYADNDEIKEILDLLKYASKPLLDKFVEKLQKVKQDTEEF